MLFLKFYILSTVIAMVVYIITVKALAVKLKREGFKTSKETSTFEMLHSILPLLIPVINIGLTFAFIFNMEYLEKQVKRKI